MNNSETREKINSFITVLKELKGNVIVVEEDVGNERDKYCSDTEKYAVLDVMNTELVLGVCCINTAIKNLESALEVEGV